MIIKTVCNACGQRLENWIDPVEGQPTFVVCTEHECNEAEQATEGQGG